MKKIAIFLSMALFVVPPSWAGTDAKTAQFLRKLNLYYYCPSREGLKGFTCVLTLHVSEPFKKSMEDMGNSQKLMDALDGQKFNLEITAYGKGNFSPQVPSPTGDPKFDAQYQKQLNDIVVDFNPVFHTWTSDVFKPGYDEETLSNAVCTVSKQPQGFVVDQKASDGSVFRLVYDSKRKVTEGSVILNNGKTIMNILLNYSSGAKGYQLDSYQATSEKLNIYEADQFTYGPVEKYILPKRIIKEIRFGNTFEKGSTLTVDFSNYQFTNGKGPVPGLDAKRPEILRSREQRGLAPLFRRWGEGCFSRSWHSQSRG